MQTPWLIAALLAKVNGSQFLHSFLTLSFRKNTYLDFAGGNHLLAYSSLQYMTVQRNRMLLDNLDVWGPEFTINVEINFNSWSGNLDSVFRFSADRNDNMGKGRVPLVVTKRDSPGWLRVVIFASDVNKFFFVGPLVTGTWYNLVFSQRKSLVSERFIIDLKFKM